MKRIQKSMFITILAMAVLITACNTASPVPDVLSANTQITPTDETTSTGGDPKAKLGNQCLNNISVPPSSSSIIILRSLKDVIPRQYPDIILVDMSKDQIKQTTQKINITPDYSVSPNGELIAYRASTITNGEVTQLELVIANGKFQTLYSVMWDDRWSSILGWTTDQMVIISSLRDEASLSAVSYTLIDPRNGRQKNIVFNISDFLGGSIYDVPYWENWYGVLMDPANKLAVYPRQSKVNSEMYTYAVWDIARNKSIFSLEEAFSSSKYFIKASPKPSWSSDGRQLAFVGGRQDESPGVFELFLVRENGDIEQLTNLTSVGYIWPSFHSWSPDNSHIVFFLTRQQATGSDVTNVHIVNIKKLDMTDLCLSVGLSDIPPIWSPDGGQFLVVDKYEEDRQRVLLVDIENKIVSPIAEDVEPIGWMIKP